MRYQIWFHQNLLKGIGLIAGLLGVIAWLPQLQKVWIQKLHEGISIPTILIICIALVLWTVYGILVDSFAIIVANLAAGGCVLSVALRVVQLRRNEKVIRIEAILLKNLRNLEISFLGRLSLLP